MRNPHKPRADEITRRDPLPRFGATVDLFAAIDAGDVSAVAARLDERVTGRVQFPDGSSFSFTSRPELLDQIMPVRREFLATGLRVATTLTNYDADASAAGIIASIDLQRRWSGDAIAPTLHRGHATLAWSGATGTWLVVRWLVTWEMGRLQSGDFSKIGQ
jgi:hypothetical protein